MPEPLISICVPVYNGEKYLKECLDSCIQQSFGGYEIIICDDCSGDSSALIINEYIQKGHAIRFYKNETNLGLVGNWNKCIELAKGEWIKFLFQDDIMSPNCLQVFYENTTEGAPLITCKRNFILDTTATADKTDYYNRQVRTLENTGYYTSNRFSASTISKLAADNLSLNFIAEPSLTLFKKELVHTIGLFDPDLKQICDLEFLLRAASNFGLIYIPVQLCEFRIHKDSTTEKNITQANYAVNHLETLSFALKLATKQEFSNLRKQISSVQRLKLNYYIKYKSFMAFKAISSKSEEVLFNALKQKYTGLFFKPVERFFLVWVSKIQARRNA